MDSYTDSETESWVIFVKKRCVLFWDSKMENCQKIPIQKQLKVSSLLNQKDKVLQIFIVNLSVNIIYAYGNSIMKTV